MRPAKRTCRLVLAGLFLSMTASLQSGDTKNLDAGRQQLNQLLTDEWEYELREQPALATMIGDYRYNDRWGDNALGHIEQRKHELQKWLSRFEAIDTTGFPVQEKLNDSLMVRNLKERIEGIELKFYEMPIDQFSGVHLELSEFASLVPLDSTRHYDDYLTRLHQVPHLIDNVIEVLEQGAKDRLMPPRFLLEKTVSQCKSIADPAGEANVFGQPATHFPEAVQAADRQRLHDAIVTAVNSEVRPAYSKLANFIATDYAPKGRTEPGIWALPGGSSRYRFEVRRMTTTDLTPDQIHDMGLKQIADIEADMLVIARQAGFQDLAGLNQHIKNDRRFYASSGQQLLDLYRKYTHQMEAELPKLFGRLPKNKLSVIPMNTLRSKDAVPADYTSGAADSSRPGRINVNEWDPEHRLLLNVEAIAYHEGIPGHHLQISVGQELQGLPAFRRHADYTAFVEGWAFYAERLAKEVGFYQDPYSDYGRLENEMWRAVRLVVDTGVHEKHWSRDQMVDLFHRYTAMDEPNIQTEVDRYIAWPGQALAYKLGQLEILKLRQHAQTELASQFDIRSFHDEILNGGALPLDILEARITAWIAAQKAGKTAAGE